MDTWKEAIDHSLETMLIRQLKNTNCTKVCNVLIVFRIHFFLLHLFRVYFLHARRLYL